MGCEEITVVQKRKLVDKHTLNSSRTVAFIGNGETVWRLSASWLSGMLMQRQPMLWLSGGSSTFVCQFAFLTISATFANISDLSVTCMCPLCCHIWGLIFPLFKGWLLLGNFSCRTFEIMTYESFCSFSVICIYSYERFTIIDIYLVSII